MVERMNERLSCSRGQQVCILLAGRSQQNLAPETNPSATTRFTAHQHANHGLEAKQGCTQANDVHSHACVQCAPDSLLLHLLALQIGALRDICVALDLSSEPSVAVRPECGEITQDYREQSRPQ
jgi:hypothetical protein